MKFGALVRAALCVVFFVVPAMGWSQGILNTERYQLDEVSGGHASVDVSLSGSAGNARLLDASASGIVGVRGERHWLRLIGGGSYLADAERRVVDDRFAQLRHSFYATPSIEAFQFVQYQANQTLLLESRWLVGGGVRTPLMRGEAVSLLVGTGVMLEVEDRDEARLGPADEARLRTVRLANQAVLTHRLPGGATVQNIVYAQPALDAWSDVRLLNDLLVRVPITEAVSMSATLEWRHDSRPPAGLKRDDVRFRTGLAIDLR